MAGRNNDYPNSKVGIEQDAERLFVDSDGNFNLAGSDVDGNDLKVRLYGNMQATVIINSAGVLSTVNIPSYHGLIIFSIADAASNASAWLTSCFKGQELIIMTRGAGSTGSVFISMSGPTCYGFASGAISSIDIMNSAASAGFIRLIATDDDEWSVVEMNENLVTLNASA